MSTVSRTPAEQHADEHNLPVVRLTNFELARILAGNPMICTDHNGNEVLVRLATADEFLAVHRAGCAKYGVEPTATRAKAIELTTPIGGTW